MVKVNEWLWEEDAEIERLEQEQMALRRIRIRNSKWDIRKLWIGSDHRTMALMLGLFAFSGYLYDPMMSGNLMATIAMTGILAALWGLACLLDFLMEQKIFLDAGSAFTSVIDRISKQTQVDRRRVRAGIFLVMFFLLIEVLWGNSIGVLS